jgi:hypothetical protein
LTRFCESIFTFMCDEVGPFPQSGAPQCNFDLSFFPHCS